MWSAPAASSSGASSGFSCVHRSMGRKQRPAKLQPGGTSTAVGTSPVSLIRRDAAPRCSAGTDDSSAWVYGCSGLSKSSAAGAISTILPRYITATRSATWRTTDMSWLMKR